jgi:phage terminase large subunit-like protein
MYITIEQHGTKWQAWACLEDLPVSEQPLAFCFVIGATRDEVVAETVAILEAVIEQLQQPPETAP